MMLSCAPNPGRGARLHTDLALLEVEIDTLWAADERGRLQGRTAPHLVLAVSDEGQIASIGAEVPDALAADLRAAVAAAGAALDPATPPASFARCERLLTDALGAVERSAGPSYVIPSAIAFESPAEVVRSDGAHAGPLRPAMPERSGWSREDWDLLLDGSFGPWACARVDGRVISLCHCARLTDRGAEAGVWTDAEFRGQGHAAAVTAAWASLLASSGRYLFYSTSAGNLSSQRVAARLGLHLIGWMWQLSGVEEPRR